MKRACLVLTMLLYVLLQGTVSLGAPKDTWTSVKSKNFLLVGNSSEKEIRKVAVKLEQFRDVFSRLFPNAKFSSPVPTTVIVFKSDSYYKPFKPNPNYAGYFQAGKDVNYITLTSEQSSQDSFRVIFHEYVHQMINNTLVSVPIWFNEGLAEYYSTFEIDDNQKVAIGKAVPEHVFWLRDHGILPLKTLFAVDHNSPYYNERNKQTFFYAESWLLMHYLLLGNNQQRMPQLSAFLQQVSNGVPLETAFTKVFQTDFPGMEKELKKYAGQNSFPLQTFTFKQKLEFDTNMSAAPVSEAEAQAYLGDLLVHTHRLDDAEKYLQQALALDPASPMANSSLGVLRTYQGRMDDARAALQKAVAGDSKNFLAHF